MASHAPEPPLADYVAIVRDLDGIELFADLDEPMLRLLAGHLVAREYAAGEPLFREGEPGEWMGLLVSGEIRICKEADSREARTVAVEAKARAIGEMALIDGEPRSATCIAARPSRVLLLSRVSFERLAQERPALAYRVILALARLISRRLRMTSGRLVEHLET